MWREQWKGDDDRGLNLLAVARRTAQKGWDTFQRDVYKAVAPLSPEQWALPVAPHHWPIARVVQHIVADRVWWFYGRMNEGSPAVGALARWDEEGQPVRSPAELGIGPKAQRAGTAQALARWT